MNHDRADLEERFRSMSDEELEHRGTSGMLTELAQEVALAEMAARGMALPEPAPAEDAAPEPYYGDMEIIASQLTYMEAHILVSCLNAAGIPADVGDAQTVQTDWLLSPILGGVRVRVPAQFVAQALEVKEAVKRGELQLDEDFDPGAPGPG